ncbi:MAG TPA: glycosyltransferase family 2 protein [Dactylosporangium sp.]|nr:glycosyltransferase family 2 protein [Dactylosporangium sp.]
MGGTLLDEDTETRIRTDVTIVVPTRNEADNVRPLVERLRAVLGGTAFEVVFVDDSDDTTPDVIRDVMCDVDDERVRLLHRPRGERAGGLGGAVVAGIGAARAPWIIVMDGDLQHPPETLPAMIVRTGACVTGDDQEDTVEIRAGADAVIATRYAGQGRADGLGGAWRRLVSRASGIVAKLVFPRRLARVSDPMSGFFAVRREALTDAALRPIGYKILLEILVRARIGRIAEVPYTFLPREAGDSKASLREGLRFARHLAVLRLATVVRPGSSIGRAVGFAAAGATGIVVNSVLLWALSRELALPYLVAAFLSMQGAIAWNFMIVDRFVMSGTERRLHRRLGRFWLINNSLVPVHLAVLAGLVQGLGTHLLVANVLAIGGVFVLRYAATSRWVYGQAGDPMTAGALRRLAVAGRRSVQIRFGLGLLLTLAAFPAPALATWRALLDGGPHVPLVIPFMTAAALLVGRLKAADAEPDVHDRQVDGLIATALLLTAGALTALAPPGDASSTWALLAVVSYLAAATVLLLGTRTAARLRWALVLPLLAIDEAAPASAAEALHRLGGAPFSTALLCLMLAALSCYGLTRRFVIGIGISLPALVAVALATGQLGGVPLAFDATLGLTVAAFAWRWSASVAVQRSDARPHYVPRGRLAFVTLALAAALLGVPGSPLASAVHHDGGLSTGSRP